ncbi:SDR family NAD(P)-dependent oxidoreductase [Streptomyces sp. NPDC050400]|uniref:SDR family NAD(P)-dependent oxidoreductase n=1 Tax=Streptomyces sp. NPDC050400 TaxID=3365610 RepID=UPI00378EC816
MSAGRLAGRTAIVTGAGDGIGRGIARRFAAEGARVLVAELNAETGRRTTEELIDEFAIDARCVITDVTQKAQVQAMVASAVDAWGRVDILVNNAWASRGIGRVEDKTDDDLRHGLAMAYYGPFWAMQAAYPHMKRQGWGRVINICSLNGVNAHMGTLEYNAAKEALRTLTRTAAREWAPTGVVVNAICPGARSAAFNRRMAANPELASAADRGNPMGRIGDPEQDIAPVALFLAGEDCRYVTGNTLFADGGAHINGVAWAPDLDGADT